MRPTSEAFPGCRNAEPWPARPGRNRPLPPPPAGGGSAGLVNLSCSNAEDGRLPRPVPVMCAWTNLQYSSLIQWPYSMGR